MTRVLTAALLALGLASPALASSRTDHEVFRDVQKQVNRYAYFTIFDSVHARIHDGHVVLTGKVTLPYKAADIARRVARVDGVTTVQNTIDVLPVSQFDDALRVSIANAIYAHPALSMYALGPNPSIHIVVERGQVTLEGVVNSNTDRLIANAVARGFNAFKVTNALQTNEEARKALERL